MKHTYRPRGIIPALVTPFMYDQKFIDEEKLRFNVSLCVDNGVHGILILGTTGEFINLSKEERRRVVKLAVDEANNEIPVIVGTGECSTKETLDFTQYAKDIGVNAALVVTPYYFKLSQRSIFNHYATIASKVDLPIILYNIPQCTGNLLNWQTIEDLAQFSNIVALKDSSPQLNLTMTVLEKTQGELNVLCGNDELVVPALSSGCHGAIISSANIIPDIWLQIYNHIQNKDLQKAQELQLKIQTLTRIIASNGPVATKAAYKFLNYNMGDPRPPLNINSEITIEKRNDLRVELEKIGKIPPKNTKIPFDKTSTPKTRFEEIGIKTQKLSSPEIIVSQAHVGEDIEAAHIDLIMGSKQGPTGEAFLKAKITPTPGHEPLIAILEHNLPVKPTTLIVPFVKINNLYQVSVVFGAAQNAIAKAVTDAVADGTIPTENLEDIILIVNLFVHPETTNKHRVYLNNYKAMRNAIKSAIEGNSNTTL